MTKTHYSKVVKGNARNYNRPVHFNYTDGYVGITQHTNNNLDRVLLSPQQVKQLLRFIEQQ